jgi:hypothetical protein
LISIKNLVERLMADIAKLPELLQRSPYESTWG